MKGLNLEGKRFGRLIVKNYSHSKNGKFWNCQCDCGNYKIVRSGDLNKGYVSSCGCLFNEGQWKRSNRRLKFGESSFNSLYNGYKRNAKDRNLEWSLSKEQSNILFQNNCFYCNTKPNQKYTSSTSYGYYIYNGIDRLDNNIGYTINNCVTCCKYCNYSKRERSHDDFLAWIKLIYDNKLGRTSY